MKAKTHILSESNDFSKKFVQKKQKYQKHKLTSKRISQQTLNFYRNLKFNRFVVQAETPLNQALKIYYNEYKILYAQNKRLNIQFIEAIYKKNELAEQLIQKKKLNQSRGGKVKRKRRHAFQIKKDFLCPMNQCGKCYGTEGSLTQHVRIKHQDFFKSGDYDLYISEILKEKQTLQTRSM